MQKEKEQRSKRKKVPPPKVDKKTSKKQSLSDRKGDVVEKSTSNGLSTIEVETQSSDRISTNPWLRHFAEKVYTTDRTGMSLSEIASLPEFSGQVKTATLAKWRTRYNWVEKRESYFKELSGELKNQIATSQMQATLNLIESLDGVFQMTYEELISGNLKFSCADRAVDVLVKVGKTNHELRNEVADKIVPETGKIGQSQESTFSAPELTHEEARVAALSVIFMRNGASAGEATEKAVKVIEKAKSEEENDG